MAVASSFMADNRGLGRSRIRRGLSRIRIPIRIRIRQGRSLVLDPRQHRILLGQGLGLDPAQARVRDRIRPGRRHLRRLTGAAAGTSIRLPQR